MSHLFISYARADAPVVYPIIERLQQMGLEVWHDAAQLRAGANWEHAIMDALVRAEAVVTFVSASPSDWVFRELEYALDQQIKAIPVLLPGGSLDSLPSGLRRYQFVDLTGEPASRLTQVAAQEIYDAFARLVGDGAHRQLRPDEVAGFAKAAEIQITDRPAAENGVRESIFIVHGHDEEMLSDVCCFLKNLAIEPIVLRDMDSGSTSLLDRFFEIGGKATDAIILLSGDDYGAAVSQYEYSDVAGKALQYRARQNVILELGYFYGLLGWDRVYVLERAPSKPFPNFERPSDLDGKVFNRFDRQGAWTAKLTRYLEQSGFNVDGGS